MSSSTLGRLRWVIVVVSLVTGILYLSVHACEPPLST